MPTRRQRQIDARAKRIAANSTTSTTSSGTVADGSITTAKLGGDITTAGKALLDDANAAAQRTTLGLGTAATAASTAFASASHTHAMSDVTSLVTTLAGKSDIGHDHDDRYYTDAETDTLLGGKADTSHTHTASAVTDFAEAVDDRVAVLLTAGTNITLTYNDAAGTLTIDATGGGSGLTHPQVMARTFFGF